MALTSRTNGHLLPCGRPVEGMWERLEDPGAVPDDHERECPHCQTARSSLLALAEATRAVLADEALGPPPALHARIMSAVRAEVRRGQRLPLTPGRLGPVDVSEQAVAVVLRFAADAVDGVRARRCRLLLDGASSGTTPSGVPTAPTALRVEMSLALRYAPGTSIALADAVRARVVAAADAHVGLDVTRVDIEVEDVYLEPDGEE